MWDGGLCAHVRDRLTQQVAAKSAEVRARVAELIRFSAQLDAAQVELAGAAPNGPSGPADRRGLAVLWAAVAGVCAVCCAGPLLAVLSAAGLSAASPRLSCRRWPLSP